MAKKKKNGSDKSILDRPKFVIINLIVLFLDILLVIVITNPGVLSPDEMATDVSLNLPYEEITTGENQIPSRGDTGWITGGSIDITLPSPEETTNQEESTTQDYGPRIIIDIEYHNQDNFPTFCEGVTTLMALKHMGYDITIDQLIEEYIPSYSLRWKDGVLIGEDPNEYFIGNPRSKDANGCYAPVIEKALIKIAGKDAVHNLTGMDIEDILAQYVNKGVPVIFWATMNMAEPTVGESWYIERTGETFTWKGKEHCLLLAGSDSKSYYFYDPLNNHGIISYDREIVEQRYEEMGRMAVALVKKADGK